MKFDCGLTKAEREKSLQQWHDIFALWPRRVGSRDCRWLETVQRRRKFYGHNVWSNFSWEYRAKP